MLFICTKQIAMRYFEFRYTILIISVFLFSIETSAQKQNNNWYFSPMGAGLNFDNCAPTLVTNGPTNGLQFEGATSISDPTTGALLFYSDGLNIFNANHTLMQNGYQVALSNSNSQTIIIKKPGAANIYYFFNTDVQVGIIANPANLNATGISYATINMALSGGLGTVTSKLNILKPVGNCEFLTAVYHSNGTDIWLIGHEYWNNKFFAYLITSTGINPSPVFSNSGPLIQTSGGGYPVLGHFDAVGELKASTDGTRLAFTTFYSGHTCLFNFNKTTGVVSNPKILQIENGGYGVSFSPDNSKLYITGVDTSGPFNYGTNGKIYQFDISSNNIQTIQNSRVTINHAPNGSYRSMKIGYDQKIYVARIGPNALGLAALGVIKNPNNSGLACNFVQSGVNLNGYIGSWGLNNSMEDTTVCLPTAMNEVNQDILIDVFPNPFDEHLIFESNLQKTFEIEIYDSLSKSVYKGSFTEAMDLTTQFMNSGIYFYAISNNGELVKRGKLIKL